ncbi:MULTISPECIES: hypothetical protein [Ralstonia]|jgi:hypothetical protein|uniref:Uncharacterized protein n=2 Tax=Ralstonia pickettii TaxID=329 RepID=R0E6L3_RALPI|nr:hypothetical protein [Ralstonia pickettii]ENZ77744.1 hypothetical protein OR214_02020 [Ralstonia pickettii OR214]
MRALYEWFADEFDQIIERSQIGLACLRTSGGSAHKSDLTLNLRGSQTNMMNLEDDLPASDPTRMTLFGRSFDVNLPLRLFMVAVTLLVVWTTYIGTHPDVEFPSGVPVDIKSDSSSMTASPGGDAAQPEVKIGSKSTLPAQASNLLRQQFYSAYMATCQINAKAGKTLAAVEMSPQLVSRKVATVMNMPITYTPIGDSAFSLTVSGNVSDDIRFSAEYAEIVAKGRRITPKSCESVAEELRTLSTQQGSGASAGGR